MRSSKLIALAVNKNIADANSDLECSDDSVLDGTYCASLSSSSEDSLSDSDVPCLKVKDEKLFVAKTMASNKPLTKITSKTKQPKRIRLYSKENLPNKSLKSNSPHHEPVVSGESNQAVARSSKKPSFREYLVGSSQETKVLSDISNPSAFLPPTKSSLSPPDPYSVHVRSPPLDPLLSESTSNCPSSASRTKNVSVQALVNSTPLTLTPPQTPLTSDADVLSPPTSLSTARSHDLTTSPPSTESHVTAPNSGNVSIHSPVSNQSTLKLSTNCPSTAPGAIVSDQNCSASTPSSLNLPLTPNSSFANVCPNTNLSASTPSNTFPVSVLNVTPAARPPGSSVVERSDEDSFSVLNCLSGEWIKTLLMKSQDGRSVLKWYKNRGSLMSRKRSILVKITIDNELDDDPSKLIACERFVALSKAICRCFPCETVGTYYIPRRRNKKRKTICRAKGKLYDRWINKRRDFRKEGIIVGRQRLDSSDSAESSESDVDLDDEAAVKLRQQIEWTENYAGSTEEEAAAYFKATISARVKIFHQEPGVKSILNFLKKYPGYTKTNDRYILILNDFDTLHPGKGSNLLSKWSQISPKIIDYAEQICSYRPDFVQTLKSLEIDLTITDERIRIINSLLLLPVLLPSLTLKKRMKICKVESKDAFLVCADSEPLAQEKLFRRKERLSVLTLPAQPTPVIVGPNKDDYNVCIGDIIYSCDSALAAVDLCCKIYFFLNTELPPDSMLALLFLKCFVYDIGDDIASEYQSLVTLKNDLKL